MGFRVLGTGSCLPQRVVTNDDLAQRVDTSDEWISSRTGIRERHIAGEGETTEHLALEAARQALTMSGVAPEALGLILCATVSPDKMCPSVASSLLEALGAVNASAFDLNGACSGFLYALRVVDGWIAHDPRPALVVGAERLSKYVDWDDRATCVLFGDGAGAVVIRPDAQKVYTECAAEPDTEGVLRVGLGPASLFMDGREVYKYATRVLVERLRGVAAQAGVLLSEIAHFLPHQANERIVKSSAEKLGLPLDRFYMNISRVGNTSAASIPIALDEMNRKGLLRVGDWLAMVAFGGGLTSAAALLQW